VRRTGDIYPSKWREKGGGDHRVPALARLHVHSHLLEPPARSPAPARRGTEGNGVSRDAGWRLGFVRPLPG
jgi:hypothetical protein